MLNSDSTKLKRYLNACYPGYRHLDDSLHRPFATKVLAQAFPDIHLDIDFVFIQSRRRYFEQLPTSSGGIIIIIDEGLSSFMAMQDTLLLAQNYMPFYGHLLMHVPYAETFLKEGEVLRSIFCAAKAQERAGDLKNLQKMAISRPGASSIRLFLLLHEIAHFAVDNRISFTEKPINDVRITISELENKTRIYEDRLRSDDPLDDLDISFNPKLSSERELMAVQTRTFLDQLTTTDQTLREASCDLVALISLLEFRLHGHIDKKNNTIKEITIREVAECLMLGIKGIRLLFGLEFIRQTVKNIAQNQAATMIHDSFSQLMMRSNAITNLTINLFEGLLDTYDFLNPTSHDDPGRQIDPTQRLLAGIRKMQDLSCERLLNPIEEIGMYHREITPEHEEMSGVVSPFFTKATPSIFEMKAIADKLISDLPL